MSKMWLNNRLDRRTQPYCPITLKNTREVAGFNELAEAMLRLDMIQAVKDIRYSSFFHHGEIMNFQMK
jgi:hypothetical protein